MSEYVRLSDEPKLVLLGDHGFQAPFPTLEMNNWCLH